MQGRHFNFLIVGVKIFVGNLKSLPGHKTFKLGIDTKWEENVYNICIVYLI